MFDSEVFEDTDIGAVVDDDEFESFWNDIQLQDIASAPTQRNDPDLLEFNVDNFENQLEEEDDECVVNLVSDVLQDHRQQKNRKRRLNEVERLEKYSWERIVRQDSEAEKRVRYKYINRNSGERVSSLRLALQQCR
jgi:hypothetical protein